MPLDNELLTALKMYSQGVNDLMISRTLSAANDQVMQIKASEDSEQAKRGRLQDLSNQLVRQLGAQGVEPTQIAAQAHAISPTYRTPGEAALAGALMGGVGGEQLVEAAGTADIAGQKGEMAKLKVQQKGQEDLLRLKYSLDAAAGKNAKPLGAQEIEKLQKYDEVLIKGKELLDHVNANADLVGPINSRKPGRALYDTPFAAFQSQSGQFFDAYRIMVTGAGASPGELKALEKNVPAVNDTAANYKAKMKRMLDIGTKVRARYLQNLQKSGRNVTNFEAGTSPEDAASNVDDVSAFIKE